MDEVEGLRLKLASEELLNSFLAEPINSEDSHYASLQSELEFSAQNLKAESWSVIVDQNYQKTLNKEAVERQDVIYEFIQTEMHHVRTLKILLHVYMYELKQHQLIEEAKLERLFCGVEALLNLHGHFLSRLKLCQKRCQEEGSLNNYQITQFGDLLISQFSGVRGERLIEWYGAFCSHHNEAMSIYKDHQQNSKKVQILMRKIRQLPLVRRLGIPECFMLVSQRITKYPVMVERIIQNTDADTDEYASLVQSLVLIKDSISQVNDQVRQHEKAVRLREICQRLEPKSLGRMMDGQLFRREDLLQGNRTLLHEGTVTWRSSGRQKDIHAVLLSDVLLLLQEKDQKLVFAAVDNKPPVISLQKLIIREVAHEDKAMYLISTCTTIMAEMYEIHTGSREEYIRWTTLIWEAINRGPEEELLCQLTATLQQFQDELKVRDDNIIQSLSEKQQIFAELYKTVMEQESPHKGLLLRGDTDQQGELLLKGAIVEVENLQNLLLRIKANFPKDEDEMQEAQFRSTETTDTNPAARTVKGGDEAESSDDGKDCSVDNAKTEDPQLQETFYPESLEQSADDGQMENRNLTGSHFLEPEVCDRVILLAQRLYSLQAIVVQQDSQTELQHAFQSKSKQNARHYNSALLEQEKQRHLEKHKQELANLHKLQAQHREEQQRWEKERERQRMQIEAREAQLQGREDECQKREEKLGEEKDELRGQRENYQQGLERLRESTKAVDKEKERLHQEKERLEQMQEKIKKLIPNQGSSAYDDPAQYWSHSTYQSFRGLTANGGGSLILPAKLLAVPTTSDPSEIPPKVPPRRESISLHPAKPELPIQLVSTTNQVNKPAPVQQQIPTKLAALSKGKEKGLKSKGAHQRTHSAASLDVSQVVPIRATGKEGGSLRAKRNKSPQRIYQSGTFNSPGSVRTSPSFSTYKDRSDTPPPAPPPFPREVLEKGKEKVIYL
ncbi:rho guanine nucleotide exchange factor 18a [Brachionichthys hirsutus]|uniref:rho guanine nucleotide exchange factor 18a n=1 Tax=Brachionichthys hirsutus TaxID=412623 RepID=UPI003604C9E8